MKWSGRDRSYAVALRTRTNSRYELGRGYFSGSPVQREDFAELDRSFRHNYQTLHELSFGYAESFTFLNGLIPRLSEFIVGVAPKIILAGSYLDVEYENLYQRQNSDAYWMRRTSYRELGSGYFNNNIPLYRQSETFRPPGASLSDMLNPAGAGLGLDIGITYLITFGSDLSVLRREDVPTEKSLRFSFSVNDLGLIYHFRDGAELTVPETDEIADEDPQLSETYFLGAPNEHIVFLNQFERTPFDYVNRIIMGRFDTLLPATINAGALFQINRLKLMGDVSYPIFGNRFASNTPVVFAGVELRPLAFLPIRAGTRLSTNQTGFYSFGTGLETRYFDLGVAVQLKSRNIGPTTEVLAASLVGIKFYIP
jgi:hypothetical protein